MMYVTTDHPVVAFFLAIGSEIAFKLKYEIHGFFHTVFEITTKTPIAQAQPAAYSIETAVEIQHEVVGLVTQETEPRCQARDAVEHVTVCDQIAPTIGTLVFHLVRDLDQAK